MPFSAPLPTPTIIAVGVAKPKAQGQAIISTETAFIKPNTQLEPSKPQPKNDNIATAITVTTK
jgi:hypothetical protein